MNYSTLGLEALQALVQKHNDLYYSGVESSDSIPDSEFDLMKQALVELEAPFDGASKTTSVVNHAKSAEVNVIHDKPMLSLKTIIDHSRDGFLMFDKQVRSLLEISEAEPLTYVCEPKYDGLGLNFKYRDGILVDVTTRGNGFAGESVLAAYRDGRIMKVCEELPERLNGEVRGECMFTARQFELLNKNLEELGEEPKKNPRNAVAGYIRSKTKPYELAPSAMFLPYYAEFDNKSFATQEEVLRWLIDVVCKRSVQADYLVVTYPTQDPYGYFVAQTDKRHELEKDGVVYKLNDRSLCQRLGSRTTEPRWAAAQKFPPQVVMTKLLGYTNSVGRTGVITPTAILAPVMVGGVEVKSSVMEHFFHIRKLKLRVGDQVELVRSGDTIPKILRVIGKRGNYVPNIRPPKTCPACGGAISRRKGFREHYCLNPACAGKVVEQLTYFASRECMNIKGLGAKACATLISEDLIQHPFDLYGLSEATLQLYIGQANGSKVFEEIHRSKYQEDWKFLTALSIREIGPSTAKKICKKVLLKDLFETMSTDDIFAMMESIGEVSASKWLIDYIKSDIVGSVSYYLIACLEMWHKLEGIMINTTSMEAVVERGKFLITGSFDRPRKEIEAELEKLGWKSVSGINAKLTAVIAGHNATIHKVEKAKKMDIPVLTLESFRIHYL